MIYKDSLQSPLPSPLHLWGLGVWGLFFFFYTGSCFLRLDHLDLLCPKLINKRLQDRSFILWVAISCPTPVLLGRGLGEHGLIWAALSPWENRLEHKRIRGQKASLKSLSSHFNGFLHSPFRQFFLLFLLQQMGQSLANKLWGCLLKGINTDLYFIFDLFNIYIQKYYIYVCIIYIYMGFPGCCCSVAKSWPTLCNPMDCSPSGSSVHGFS